MSSSDAAFIEIDQHKMTRDQLVILGMREELNMWIDILKGQADAQENFGPRMLLLEVARHMTDRRDDVTAILTKNAVKTGSAKLHNIKVEA